MEAHMEIDALARMQAKQEILEGLYRYCHAVDRIDPSLLATVWHTGALAHYEGFFDGPAGECMERVLESHRACEATSHQVTNALIEVAGDSATSQCYVMACVRSGPVDVVVRGRYSDRWSRRDGAWRIDERTYTQDVMELIPVDKPSPAR
jgi:SnoaL-like domain